LIPCPDGPIEIFRARKEFAKAGIVGHQPFAVPAADRAE
jgi:hypothetical protein